MTVIGKLVRIILVVQIPIYDVSYLTLRSFCFLGQTIYSLIFVKCLSYLMEGHHDCVFFIISIIKLAIIQNTPLNINIAATDVYFVAIPKTNASIGIEALAIEL